MDRAVASYDELKPLGNLKITMQKFFRVNGGSTQLKGVIPDVIFPDNYHYIDTGEKDYDFAMKWSEIDPVVYNQDVYQVPDLKMINSKSNSRTSEVDQFQKVLANAKRLKKNRDETSYPLEFDAYNDLVDTREEEAEAFEGLYLSLIHI